MPKREIEERRRLKRELDDYLAMMDLDSFRFLVCVAGLRVCSDAELERVNELLQGPKVCK